MQVCEEEVITKGRSHEARNRKTVILIYMNPLWQMDAGGDFGFRMCMKVFGGDG